MQPQLFHVTIARGHAPARNFTVSAETFADAITNLELAVGRTEDDPFGNELFTQTPMLSVTHLRADDLDECRAHPYGVKEVL